MSSSIKVKINKKKQNIKNSTLFRGKLIQYNKEDKDSEFYNEMKLGYLEMASINLQIAIDNEGELADIKNYETWLCGV